MSAMKTRTLTRLVVALGAVAALAAPSASRAIIGGEQDTTGLFTGVASLVGSGGGVASAVLISADWALTAAHAVCGGPLCGPSSPGYTLNFNFPGGPQTRGIQQIVVKDGYAGFGSPGADGLVHNDLALLHLATAAPVAGYGIADMLFGETLTLVGYGGSGPFGGPPVGADAANRFYGHNAADQALGPPQTAGAPIAEFDVYGFNVLADGSSGVQLAGGDSGGAALVLRSGSYLLAGINTFTFAATIPGQPETGTIRGGGGIVLDAYRPWIEQVTAVPEPGTWGLFAAGLMVLVVRRAAGGPRAARGTR